jgi:hypothetical protein
LLQKKRVFSPIQPIFDRISPPAPGSTPQAAAGAAFFSLFIKASSKINNRGLKISWGGSGALGP